MMINVLQSFVTTGKRTARFYSLPQLEAQGIGVISRLPVSIRILLESVLRNYDGHRIAEENIIRLANWQPNAERTEELPFVVSRVLLQDFAGVPLIVDLAVMRSEVVRLGRNPKIVEPMVPVDLVIDHSVQAELGFHLTGYGCTTCIGTSGPLDPCIEEAIRKHDLVAASVLSGNRNFEARVHQSIRANFLMSPPLVVTFALAGTVAIDLQNEPLGKDKDGHAVFLREIWPSDKEINILVHATFESHLYQRRYSDFAEESPMWNEISEVTGDTYDWTTCTYILEPPYFDKFSMEPEKLTDICSARSLAIFGDSVTTDHISPAGAIKGESPAGTYLQERGRGL